MLSEERYGRPEHTRVESERVNARQEWLVTTPMHAALYDALGWQPPEFVHV